MNFDMNRTWSDAVELVQSNFQLLAVIAGVFILIPTLIFYMAVPDFMMAATSMEPDSGAMEALLADNAGILVVTGLLVILAQFIAYAAMVALVGGDRPTVGEALAMAGKAIPTLIGVTLLMMVIYVLFGLVLALAIGLIVAAISSVAGTLGIVLGTLIASVCLFGAIIYAVARFLMVYPAIMLEGEKNPVAALKRSLSLTKPHAKRIFWFLALIFVAYLVISMVVSGIFTLLASTLGSGTGAALMSGLLNGVMGALVAMIYAGLMVAMYTQLTGGNASIGETFD